MGAGAERAHFGLRPRLCGTDRRRRGGAGPGPRLGGGGLPCGDLDRPVPDARRAAVATSRRGGRRLSAPPGGGAGGAVFLAGRADPARGRLAGDDEWASSARPGGSRIPGAAAQRWHPVWLLPGAPSLALGWGGRDGVRAFQCSIWEASGSPPQMTDKNR